MCCCGRGVAILVAAVWNSTKTLTKTSGAQERTCTMMILVVVAATMPRFLRRLRQILLSIRFIPPSNQNRVKRKKQLQHPCKADVPKPFRYPWRVNFHRRAGLELLRPHIRSVIRCFLVFIRPAIFVRAGIRWCATGIGWQQEIRQEGRKTRTDDGLCDDTCFQL